MIAWFLLPLWPRSILFSTDHKPPNSSPSLLLSSREKLSKPHHCSSDRGSLHSRWHHLHPYSSASCSILLIGIVLQPAHRHQILNLCNFKEDVRKKVHSMIEKFAECGLRSLGVARQVFDLYLGCSYILFCQMQTKRTMENGIPYVVLGILYAYLLYLLWTPETLRSMFANKYWMPKVWIHLLPLNFVLTLYVISQSRVCMMTSAIIWNC